MQPVPMMKKATPVTAVLFTGGPKNAKDIIEWGAKNNLEISWSYRHSLELAKDGVGFRDALIEDLHVNNYMLSVGDWIVLDEFNNPSPADGNTIATNYTTTVPATPATVPPPVSALPRAAMGSSYADRYLSKGPMMEEK